MVYYTAVSRFGRAVVAGLADQMRMLTGSVVQALDQDWYRKVGERSSSAAESGARRDMT